MNTEAQDDDEQFELAYCAWRQFFGMCLDRPAPSQPEIDARLLRYRRAHEAGSLASFGTALIIVAGIARALLELTAIVPRVGTIAEGLIFLLTCALMLGLAMHALQRLRWALEWRSLAQRIGVDTVDPGRVASLFADIREPAVRDYVNEVLGQGRRLRKAEAAVALDRGRGGGLDAVSRADFARAVRGRRGTQPREVAIAAACLVAVLAAGTPRLDAVTLLPPLYLLGGVALAGLPYTVLQLAMDPWSLAGGGPTCRRIRAGLVTDLLPQLAVFLAVVVTAAAITAVPG